MQESLICALLAPGPLMGEGGKTGAICPEPLFARAPATLSKEIEIL